MKSHDNGHMLDITLDNWPAVAHDKRMASKEIFTMLDLLGEQLGKDTVAELIAVYTSNSTDQLAKMTAALGAGDLPALSRLAHSLKSSSANLGASALQAACMKLEKSSAVDGATPELLESIRQLHAEAVAAMVSWKPQS